MNVLPAPTRSKLRSTQILTSLPQVIAELVQNSLDAGARHVQVGVDAQNWSCWVKDDGCGMSREDMQTLAQGLEDRRYSTSKVYSQYSLNEVEGFGFRGEALASMADLACLEVNSRTASATQSWSVILKAENCLYNGPTVRWTQNGSGTAVYARDVFYSMPVRRLSHPAHAKTLELIRKELGTLALVFPSVTFTMDDISKAHDGQADRSRVMSIPKTQNMAAAFKNIHGRALVGRVYEVNETRGSMRIEGFISLTGSLSKNHQHLYLNRHSLAWCDLHRVIDLAVSRSSFARFALDEDGEQNTADAGTRRSPRKTEKKPVYVLNVTLPRRDVDNCLEPAKAVVHLRDQDTVSSFLTVTVEAFLVKHGFKVPGSASPSSRGASRSPSPRKRRRLDENQGGHALPSPTRGAPRSFLSRPVSPAKCDLVAQPGSAEGEEVLWTDPETGKAYRVDMATGNSYPADRPRISQQVAGQSPARPALGGTRRTLNNIPGRSAGPEQARGDAPEWIQRALQSNTAYAVLERPVREAPREDVGYPGGTRPGCGACHEPSALPFPSSQLPSSAARTSLFRELAPGALCTARVLGQVDRKFVACVLALGRGRSALVLVDQHAAHERVRVERLLAPACAAFLTGASARVRALAPPVPVLLAAAEARALAENGPRAALARWGVTLDEQSVREAVCRTGSDDAHVQVHVCTVPETVADKLLSGDELRDLIKGYLAALDEAGPALALPPPSIDTGTPWQTALRWCPPALLYLLNSRACRGAIMFNDMLDGAQCRRLVAELAETALPFQCAHGRPSIAPISRLDAGAGIGGRRRAPPIDWACVAPGQVGRRVDGYAQ